MCILPPNTFAEGLMMLTVMGARDSEMFETYR